MKPVAIMRFALAIIGVVDGLFIASLSIIWWTIGAFPATMSASIVLGGAVLLVLLAGDVLIRVHADEVMASWEQDLQSR